MVTLAHTVPYGQSVASLNRSDWIAAALARLARHGVDAVRIEPLAAQLGVSKGSFYWHFTHRDDLLDAILITWRDRGTDQVVTLTDASHGDPEQRLRTLLRTAYGFQDTDGIEVAVRAWAASDERARDAVTAVDNARVDYVASLLHASGLASDVAHARSRALYRALLGEFLMRTYGTPATPESEVDAIAATALRQ